jgi:anti-sigma B factor antagonist
MKIEKKITGDHWEFFLPGRIDGAAANQLEIEILEATRHSAKAIYVNLCESTFLCSAGIRVLLQYWRQMRKNGHTFYVTRPSPEVVSALEMTGFSEIIEK